MVCQCPTYRSLAFAHAALDKEHQKLSADYQRLDAERQTLSEGQATATVRPKRLVIESPWSQIASATPAVWTPTATESLAGLDAGIGSGGGVGGAAGAAGAAAGASASSGDLDRGREWMGWGGEKAVRREGYLPAPPAVVWA
jgi:hypothetical protein